MTEPSTRDTLLLVCVLALAVTPAHAQSLSISKGQQGASILANTPEDARFVLQGSQDWKLWLDLNDTVSGTVSNTVPLAGSASRYFRLASWTEAPSIRIVILGDSTVADLAANLDRFNGWGQGMYGYFKSNAQVINLASPGLGTKNFLVSDQKDKMMAIKPEYVLIELCYIDAFTGPPEVTTTLAEYEENLKAIVELIRSFEGTPILIMPQALWLWDPATGKTAMTYPERNVVIQKVAAEMKVYLVDLTTPSVNLLNRLGKDGSQYLFLDWMHFTTVGAEIMAGFVVNALPPSLGPYIVPESAWAQRN